MPCFADGQPQIPPPFIVRHYLNDLTINGAAETISIQWVATAEVQLEQLTVHWASPLATSEFLVLSKTNTTIPAYSTILIKRDPFMEGIFDLVCLSPFRWRVGETVYLGYPNTDDIGIGAEIILREV